MEGVNEADTAGSRSPCSSSSSSSESEVEHGFESEGDDVDRCRSPPPPHRIGSGCQVILDRVLEEEAELRRTVKQLRETLGEANRLLVKRQDEVRELKERKQLLMEGGGQRPTGGDERGQPQGGQSESQGPKRKKTDDEGDDEEGSKSKRLRGKQELEGEVNPGLEGLDAELILPEEVWRIIIGKLKTPKHLWKASQICQLFKKITEPIPFFLFDMVFPLLFKYLDSTLILNLRSTCTRWNLIVDDFFENHPYHRPQPIEDINPSTGPRSSHPAEDPMTEKTMGLYRFSNFVGDLRTAGFMDEMKDHPRNPFLGRSLLIAEFDLPDELMENMALHADSDEEDDDEVANMEILEVHQRMFWREVNKFLDVFGQHIWYLIFVSNVHEWSDLGRVGVHRFLAGGAFTHCPNLRSFCVAGHLPDVLPGDLNLPQMRFGNPVESVFPTMSQLETLNFGQGVYSPSQIIPDAMVKHYFAQLRSLHLKRFRKGYGSPAQLEGTRLTELHLDLDLDRLPEGIKMLDWMRLPQLRRLDISLEKKGVILNPFKILLETLNKLSESSPLLSVLQLGTGFCDEDVANLPPNLYAPPNVKVLESLAPSCSYTFLLRFPFLEDLNIRSAPGFRLRLDNRHRPQEDIEAELEKEVVQLHSFMYGRELYQSNVWRMLPRLQFITFRKETFSRREYEKLKCDNDNDK